MIMPKEFSTVRALLLALSSASLARMMEDCQLPMSEMKQFI